MKPVRIQPKFVERVWGSRALEPWFLNRAEKIGEVWFPVSDDYPLLVKFLFTSDRLSVQVHPDDDYAAANHNGSRGKTEMWHILRADPGSTIALGFTREIMRAELRAASENGAIVDLLRWIPVNAGETYLTPAGTVHAIGGGIVLCEIQQNSDITYRLYDYNRKPERELHLDHGEEVSHLGPYPAVSLDRVACRYFETDKLGISSPRQHAPKADELLIVLRGSGILAGEAFAPGQVWHVPEGTPPFTIKPENTARLLRTYPPLVDSGKL
ncbi:MAG: class I mannose-6-phosphate isomerase [Acidobacteriota bacterium]|nr:class I mannose-6-phosphate isomerase [Acidobacteriota bacterium]